jgi:hypothetical protein
LTRLKPLLPQLFVVVAIAGSLGLVLGSDWAVSQFGVPRIKPAFADTAVLTSGWECSRRGVDVLRSNPCDPYGDRPTNYPRLWLAARSLGLGHGATKPIAIGMIALFLAAIWFLTAAITFRGALVWAAIACSPPVLLALERGNIDLLMFVLVTLAVAVAARGLVRLSAGAIGLAAALKLYPVAAVAILLRQPRRWLIAAGTLLAGFAGYAFAIRHDIDIIASVTPDVVVYSYGAGALLQGLGSGEYGVLHAFPFFGHGVGRALAWALIPCAVIAAGLAIARVLHREAVPSDPLDWRPDALIAGAAILTGTYLLGYNFDYRLIFVLLAVPQLLAWERMPGQPRVLARTALAAMFIAFWTSSSISTATWAAHLLSARVIKAAPHLLFPLDELALIAVMVVLAGGAFSVLYGRLRPVLAHD